MWKRRKNGLRDTLKIGGLILPNYITDIIIYITKLCIWMSFVQRVSRRSSNKVMATIKRILVILSCHSTYVVSTVFLLRYLLFNFNPLIFNSSFDYYMLFHWILAFTLLTGLLSSLFFPTFQVQTKKMGQQNM